MPLHQYRPYTLQTIANEGIKSANVEYSKCERKLESKRWVQEDQIFISIILEMELLVKSGKCQTNVIKCRRKILASKFFNSVDLNQLASESISIIKLHHWINSQPKRCSVCVHRTCALIMLYTVIQ